MFCLYLMGPGKVLVPRKIGFKKSPDTVTLKHSLV